jgi:hypothetical protein
MRGIGPARRLEMSATAEFARAVTMKLDSWVPACGGTETPFKARSGATLLYCYNPKTGRHAYLDCGTDMILTDEDARAHLGTY